MIVKISAKKDTKLYNTRVAECAYGVPAWDGFTGPYIGSKLFFPDDFKTLHGLKFYFHLLFNSAETYKQIYKIVIADSFFDSDRTYQNEIIGPWLAGNNNQVGFQRDLSGFIVPGCDNWIILYANNAYIDDGSVGCWGSGNIVQSFVMEGWYETKEH